ncbi:MAG: hypothetical protein M1337_02730, partial [Actinobacteria bacterium]|nr:hypothetical protein [Actinomycetota bacterium]
MEGIPGLRRSRRKAIDDMPSPEYHRPKKLHEALTLLQSGTALGGGTRLTRHASRLASIVDLQALGLDLVVARAEAGFGCFQRRGDPLPEETVEACRSAEATL